MVYHHDNANLIVKHCVNLNIVVFINAEIKNPDIRHRWTFSCILKHIFNCNRSITTDDSAGSIVVDSCIASHDIDMTCNITIWILVPCDIVHWSATLHHSQDGLLGVRCSGVERHCVPFTFSLNAYYFIMTFVTIIGIMAILFISNNKFRLSVLSSSGSAMRTTLDFSAPVHSLWILDWSCCSGLFMLYSDSLLGNSTGECETLQLIVRVVYGAVDYPLASCMFVHFLFWKWNLKWLWVCKFHKLEVSFFTALICFTYILKPHNVIILYSPFPYFHVSNNALFFT